MHVAKHLPSIYQASTKHADLMSWTTALRPPPGARPSVAHPICGVIPALGRRVAGTSTPSTSPLT